MSKRPLRVHTLIDSLTWGGAEMLLADLAAGAPAAGIELSVGYLRDVDGSPAAGRLRAAGIEPTLLGAGKLLERDSLRRVRAHLRALAPEILHTHLPTADVLGAIAARSLGLPVVSTVHLIGRAVSDPPGPRTTAKEGLTALARRYGDARIVAVSDAARHAYIERWHERPARVVTIHNGIAAPARAPWPASAHAPPTHLATHAPPPALRTPSPPPTERAPADVRAELGIPAEALLVAIVTVLRAGKGHDLALQAVAQLRDSHPSLTLLLVGDGPERARIAELAAPLGAGAVLAGHRDDVPEILAATDVLLHPTAMDAFPTSLLEAGAAGVPVLATAVGGIPEIVSDEQTGLLLTAPTSASAIAAALGRLLDDADLRARLGAAARVRYEREFSAERWAARLRSLYDEVLAARGS